jgi:hypothetical protein
LDSNSISAHMLMSRYHPTLRLESTKTLYEDKVFLFVQGSNLQTVRLSNQIQLSSMVPTTVLPPDTHKTCKATTVPSFAPTYVMVLLITCHGMPVCLLVFRPCTALDTHPVAHRWAGIVLHVLECRVVMSCMHVEISDCVMHSSAFLCC